MPWDQFILEQFDSVPDGIAAQSDESHLYGPYNTLLFYLFPPSERFMISPQWRGAADRRSIDFTTLFIVERNRHPVFFLEVKPARHFGSGSARALADQQMRERVDILRETQPLPTLYGVSVLGTRLALYTYTAATRVLDPPRILPDPYVFTDSAPAARWGIDILSEEGVALMKDVANRIKEMTAAVQFDCAFSV